MGRRHGAIFFALLLGAAAPMGPAAPSGEVQRVAPTQALAILGQTVVDPSGKAMGRLVDVLVGDHGQPQAAVIDFGGFMGVGSRRIAVQWDQLHFVPSDTQHPITLNLTQDQIRTAPEYKNPARPVPIVAAPPAHADTKSDKSSAQQ